MVFTLGQRWISDTESELGLGTVVAIDTRMITLLFPATGKTASTPATIRRLPASSLIRVIPSPATKAGRCASMKYATKMT